MNKKNYQLREWAHDRIVLGGSYLNRFFCHRRKRCQIIFIHVPLQQRKKKRNKAVNRAALSWKESAPEKKE